MTVRPPEASASVPAFEHGDWVQVYVDPDPTGDGPGLVRIVESHGAPGVVVLPIWQGQLGLVTVYRRLLGRSVLEAPRGFGEGMGARSDAVRELWEETGLRVDEGELITLGPVAPNSGLLASQVELFAVRLSSVVESSGIQDTAEVQGFEWHPLTDVLAMVRDGDLIDAFTLVALFRAMLRGVVVGEPSRDHLGAPS